MLQVWESQFIPFAPLLQEDEGECMSGGPCCGPPVSQCLGYDGLATGLRVAGSCHFNLAVSSQVAAAAALLMSPPLSQLEDNPELG